MTSLRILSMGWGVQSFAMAAMVALGEIPPVAYAVHADTGHEASGTYAHAKKWTPWLEERGVHVVTVKSARNDVVEDKNAVMIPAFTVDPITGKPGQIRRECTGHWKITPIRRFLRTIVKPTPGAVESLQGISLDEFQRMRTSDVGYIVNAYPLVELRITRADCVTWLEAHGLDVPPKSACTFCPYHSLASWREMKRVGGSDWARAIAVDEAIRQKGSNSQKGELFVHPARRPLAQAVDIPEDHGAKQLTLDEAPCDSGYCFT
jgi:hypothetical protein